MFFLGIRNVSSTSSCSIGCMRWTEIIRVLLRAKFCYCCPFLMQSISLSSITYYYFAILKISCILSGFLIHTFRWMSLTRNRFWGCIASLIRLSSFSCIDAKPESVFKYCSRYLSNKSEVSFHSSSWRYFIDLVCTYTFMNLLLLFDI